MTATSSSATAVAVAARDNPFRTECVDSLAYQPEGWTWDGLMSRLGRLHYRAAIVGPMGAGKTTLMEHLGSKLNSAGFAVHCLRLDRDSPRLRRPQLEALTAHANARGAILLDGCEQMSYFAWKHFLWTTRKAGGLLITTHQPGRLPTLVECRPSLDVLRRMVTTLAGDRVASRAHLQELHARHGGNIRTAFRELYDRASEGGWIEPD